MIRKTLTRIGVALTVLVGTGCMSLGALEDVYASERYDDELSGRVRRVDERRQRIEIENGRGTREVYYDSRTRVVDDGREYRVRSLDRGDRVSVRVRRDRRGYAYAERIRVTRNARGDDDRWGDRDRDRDGDWHGGGRRQVLTGRVERVDRDRGAFRLDVAGGPDVWVSVPRALRDSRRDRFWNLDRGERVSVEGHFTDRGRFRAERIR